MIRAFLGALRTGLSCGHATMRQMRRGSRAARFLACVIALGVTTVQAAADELWKNPITEERVSLPLGWRPLSQELARKCSGFSFTNPASKLVVLLQRNFTKDLTLDVFIDQAIALGLGELVDGKIFTQDIDGIKYTALIFYRKEVMSEVRLWQTSKDKFWRSIVAYRGGDEAEHERARNLARNLEISSLRDTGPDYAVGATIPTDDACLAGAR